MALNQKIILNVVCLDRSDQLKHQRVLMMLAMLELRKMGAKLDLFETGFRVEARQNQSEEIEAIIRVARLSIVHIAYLETHISNEPLVNGLKLASINKGVVTLG